jgi:RecA-family ATPase
MSLYNNDPFYGKETINDEFLRIHQLPQAIDKKIFVKCNPEKLHKHADEFFKNIVGKKPERFNLTFKSEFAISFFPAGSDLRDFRRTLIAMDKIGYSCYYSLSKGCKKYDADQVYVSTSRFYKPMQLRQMLKLPEKLGMPEPTMIQTRGDGIIRYIYFLDYKTRASLDLEKVDLQSLLNRLWAGAEVEQDSNENFMVPGFGDYRLSKNSQAKIRTIGGNALKLEASTFYNSINQLIAESPDQIIYAFTNGRKVNVENLIEEDIHSIAKQILKAFTPKEPLGMRHFFVAYVQALFDIGIPFVNPKHIANKLPYEVDYLSCPGNKVSESNEITSCYFWNLAESYAGINRKFDKFEQESSQSINVPLNTCGNASKKKHGEMVDTTNSIEATLKDIERLKIAAMQITTENQDKYIADQFQIFRSFAKSLDNKFDQSYIQEVFNHSLMHANGSLDPLTPENELQFDSVPWLWENIIIDKTANLLVAQPKIGKTTLILAFLAALLNGEGSFLGKEIQGLDRKVVIVGTDQPESDWARMLEDVGLLDEERKMHPSLIRLHTAGCPLYLDERGFETLESYARENQNLIILVDSFAACTSVLGLDENSSAAGQVVQQLVNRMATHGATVVIIHHSGKGNGIDSPTVRSRGSTAIPAAVSQIISLSRFSSNQQADADEDGRIILSTEGRAGQPTKMFIQRTETGWKSLEDGKTLEKEQRRNQELKGLSPRQKICLEFVEKSWMENQRTISAADLVEALSTEFKGSDPERSARAVLSQLEDKGLIKCQNGKPLLWHPVTVPKT